MTTLVSLNGEQLNNKSDIAKEIHAFYTKLLGIASSSIDGIDKVCMLKRKSLTREEGLDLRKIVSAKEVWNALESIGNNKAPRVDGFNDFFL